MPSRSPAPVTSTQSVGEQARLDRDEPVRAAVDELHRVAAALPGEQRLDRHGQHVLAALDGEADVDRRLVEARPPAGAAREVDGDVDRRVGVLVVAPLGLVATLPTSAMRPRAVEPDGRSTVTLSPSRAIDWRRASRSTVTSRSVEDTSASWAPGATCWPTVRLGLADRASRPGGRRPHRATACRSSSSPRARLEAPDRCGGRPVPVVVDRHVVAGVVAERPQVALELAHVLAVGHAGREVAPRRQRAVEQERRRRAVHRIQRVPARDDRARVAQPA